MPKIPQPSTILQDGTYNLKVVKVETTNGKFGPQEELTLKVCNEQWDETDQQTRTWIGHNAVKSYEMARKANILIVDTESQEWVVKCPVFFVGYVMEGKIKGMVKAGG